jgi:hypothetical protein
MTNQTIGFNHCHLDDYVKQLDIDGETKDIKPVRMFSPDDIFQFQKLIINAKYYNIPYESIYGNMVITNYTYTLTTSGTINNSYIQPNIKWSKLERLFLRAMKNPDKETTILKFIQQYFGTYDIKLVKTDSYGKTDVLTLDSSNKLIITTCN